MSSQDAIILRGHRRDTPKKENKSVDEQNALKILKREARKRNCTLASGGKGGLPPSLVLGIMRRDGFECKVCGLNEKLSIHHKGGIFSSPRMKRRNHSNQFNNLVTICVDCHDALHTEAKRHGYDSSGEHVCGKEGCNEI